MSAAQAPGDVTAFADLPAAPEAARWARRVAAAALGAWNAPAGLTETAVTIASELVANASRVAGAPIRLTLRIRPGHVVIEVADDHPALPVADSPGPDAESGRGLLIVGAFAKEWGTSPRELLEEKLASRRKSRRRRR